MEENKRMKENPTKIFVAVPSRDVHTKQIDGELAGLIFNMQNEKEYEIEYEIFGGQPVELARNNLVKRFLETDCEYILMVDDDIVPPRDILDMARHGKDIVAGLCYAFNPRTGIFPVAYEKVEKGHFRGNLDLIGRDSEVENKGLKKVYLVGSGCILISRRVFDRIEEPYFRFIYNDEVTKIEDSEDFDFCRRAVSAGFEVYIDTDRVCGHKKSVDLKAMMKWATAFSEEKSMIKIHELYGKLFD